MDINVNASPITQVATTTAVGGPGIFGDGGDATAVTSQHADSSNIQLGDNHFPWGGGYDYGPDLNVNASPITQVALGMYLRLGFVLLRQVPPRFGVPYRIYLKRL